MSFYGLGPRPSDEACICCGTGQAAVMGRCYGCDRDCDEKHCRHMTRTPASFAAWLRRAGADEALIAATPLMDEDER